MSGEALGLIDCNNFFVSCERVFDPTLIGKPTIVLSNNDGCVVSRSNEVKKLGIKVGQPVFKIRELVRQHKIQLRSSNFQLYADMSDRVMKIISDFCPNIEIYSIDEAFVLFDTLEVKDPVAYAAQLASTVLKWTGIPVAIGLANTKTLAKVGADRAKKVETGDRVFSLLGSDKLQIDAVLDETEISDVWGIGWRFTEMLRGFGISTAREFKYCDPNWVRRKMTVLGYRTLLELNGVSCYSLHTSPSTRKSICSTRTFGSEISRYEDLSKAVLSFVSVACEKLRKDRNYGNSITVFIQTNRFKRSNGWYHNSYSSVLDAASNFTPDFAKAALLCLKKVYRADFRYKRAGVVINGITPPGAVQFDLFNQLDFQAEQKKERIMKSIDQINQTWGHEAVRLVGQQNLAAIQNRQMLSKRYTTSWKELLTVKI